MKARTTEDFPRQAMRDMLATEKVAFVFIPAGTEVEILNSKFDPNGFIMVKPNGVPIDIPMRGDKLEIENNGR